VRVAPPGEANGFILVTKPHSKQANSAFIVARNPDERSKLPFLLHVPVDGGVWFKAKEDWPRASRVYCHPAPSPDPQNIEILDAVPVRFCSRRGPVVDLVLNRGANSRSQFVFTRFRGRPMVFWQTPKAAASARPGLRVPQSRDVAPALAIVIDTRERYPYRFAGGSITVRRENLRVGDYAVRQASEPIAVVERKTLEDFTHALSDGSLSFAMAALSELPVAAIVVEGSYSRFLRQAHAPQGWLDDVLVRLQARYPTVPVMFLESRKLAEHWTLKFLATSMREYSQPRLELSALADPAAQIERVRTFIRKARARKGRNSNLDASNPTT
jgi:ERCC4-type nuclease